MQCISMAGLKLQTYLLSVVVIAASPTPISNAGGGLKGGNHFLMLPSVHLSHGDD
jgi:hypothetical protein